jgi:hypothetical protein
MMLDFFAHFVMDRVKASPKLLGRYKVLSATDLTKLLQEQQHLAKLHQIKAIPDGPYKIELVDRKFKENKYFWWALGFDQMVHHLTDLLVVWIVFTFGY